MNRLYIFLVLVLCFSSCEEDFTITCTGDCKNPTFIVDGETGTDVTYNNYTYDYTYDPYGQVSKVTISGSVTYNDSGNTYHVEGVANYSPCDYRISVWDADGKKATCTN